MVLIEDGRFGIVVLVHCFIGGDAAEVITFEIDELVLEEGGTGAEQRDGSASLFFMLGGAEIIHHCRESFYAE